MKPTMFTQPNQPQEVVFEPVGEEQAKLLEVSLEDLSLSFSSFMIDRDITRWRVSLILDGNQRDALTQRLANLKAHFNLPEARITPLQMQDWVALVQQHFKPISAGRYYIHGSHITTPPPLSCTPILLDAGAAFGTGEHETTKGCLIALDGLFRARRFHRVLDMGCGTGVLAIAAAKTLRVPVDAVDNDAVSVRVARENVARNRVSSFVTLQCGDGYSAPLLREKRYDLIIANILARPLMLMAQDVSRHLEKGGMVVLSGLLNRQEEMVLMAHRMAGLRLVSRRRLGPWSVLVVGK